MVQTVIFGAPIMAGLSCWMMAVALMAEPAVNAEALAPYVGESTIGVVRVQLTKLKLPAAASALFKSLELEAGEKDKATQAIDQSQSWLDKLTQAGVTEAYVVIGTPPSEPIPASLIVPLAAGADADAVKSLLEEGPAPQANPKLFAWVRAGKGIVTAGWSKEPDELEATARPDIAATFALVSDAPIQVVVTPPDGFRQALEESMPRLPAPFGGPSSVLARGFRSAALSVTLPPELSLRLTVQAKDADAAEALAGLWRRGLALAVEMAPESLRDQLGRMAKSAEAKVSKDQIHVTVTDARPAFAAFSAAVRSAREAALRTASMGHLKQLGLALHNYHDSFGSFPPAAIHDKAGKALLSWRVAVLPYVEEQQLYNQFHLDEPWDSEHNKKLIDKMPRVFRHRLSKAENGRATLLAPVGATTIFPNATAKTKLFDIKDGSSNTIMLVDVADDQAVIWTKPDDWIFDAKNPSKGLAVREGRVLALFGDGSVRSLKADLPKATWAGLFSIAGVEVLKLDD